MVLKNQKEKKKHRTQKEIKKLEIKYMLEHINVKRIVLEEINKYFKTQLLISEGLFEADDEKTPKHKKQKKHKSDKQKEWEQKIENARERDGEAATENNADSVIKFLQHPCINASKVLEMATDLAPTSASSEASKIASGEEGWEVTENLVNVVNQIKAELAS